MVTRCSMVLRLGALLLLWAVSSFAAAGNCIPKIHILSPNASDRLIADVTVIGKAASPYEGYPDSAIVRVAATYAGAAPRQIVLESGPPEVTSIDCPFDVSGVPVGTRLFINVTRDPITGQFGGGYRDNIVYVIDGMVTDLLFIDNCVSDDENCLYSPQTMSATAFAEMAESQYPGQYSSNPTIPIGRIDLGLRNGNLTPGAEIALGFETGPFCTDLSANAVRAGVTDGEMEISVDLRALSGEIDITPAPPCFLSWTRSIPVGRVYQSGSYVVRVYAEPADASEGFFQSSNFVGELPFEVTEASELANAETPAQGSVQSGVGLIRGWACDASSVQVQFDDLPPLSLAYGTSRLDTLSVCGDANNGYGAAFAWGSLGEGPHTMTTWIDGRLISTVEFEVAGLGSPFRTGLSGEYELGNFPAAGQSVIVTWSQPDQNFIITDRTD